MFINIDIYKQPKVYNIQESDLKNKMTNYSIEEPAQPEKISLYNSGMAQIKRLDELWIKIHKYVESGQLPKWNWGLDRIWCELVGDLQEDGEEEEAEDNSKKEKSPTKKFEEFNMQVGNINKQFVDKTIPPVEYQRLLYQTLMDKEAFLRRLQNKLGKGTKLIDADEDMIE